MNDRKLIETEIGSPPAETTPWCGSSTRCRERFGPKRWRCTRELCDLLGECVEQPWTREDARLWWETRLEPEAVVSLVDPS